MKKISLFAALMTVISSCSTLSRVSWDSNQLANAAAYGLKSVSLTEAEIISLSQQTVSKLDAKNKIDNGSYDARLKKLMSDVSVDGLALNYKVYQLDEVNAFACGDGSIRVYSGLMDIMNDDQLMAILGHEIGHVVHQDTKNAMKKAYAAAAARSVVNAAGAVGKLSQSALGDLAETFVSSQFSQKQEYAADEYGFNFAITTGHSPYSMYEALDKLVELSGSSQSSLVQKMFSSHPGSAERATKVRAMADKISK